MGNGAWGMGRWGDEGDEGDEGEAGEQGKRSNFSFSPLPPAPCPSASSSQCPMPNALFTNTQSFINFFCEMLKNIASIQKSETESPNLNYVNKAST